MPSLHLSDVAADLVLRWEQWQTDVVMLLRKMFGGEVLRDIGFDDIDWPSWRDLYLEGKSPHAAIERALERDL